jgi:hypothetical protein
MLRRFLSGLLLASLTGITTTARAQETTLAAPGKLAVVDEGGVLTITFGGRDGRVGIPSWKVVLRRDDAGNISSLHVPAEDATPLAARGGVWPLAVVATMNDAGISGTMSKGRENYVNFAAETFRVAETSAEKIVVDVGGPSKNRHFIHQRRYTFTPVGLKMEGSVNALIDLASVIVAFHWDRMEIADSHITALPLRARERTGWVYMMATGSDSAQPMPKFADFPLEAELRLRRATPTYIRTFFDRNFESAAGKTRLVHNNKDVQNGGHPMLFKKMICLPGGPVAKGTEQTYELRLEFESRG